MFQAYRQQLPYHADSERYFSSLRAMKHPVWLDSNGSERGRYDILAANPSRWLSCEDADEASNFLARLRATWQAAGQASIFNELPFCGGLIGLLSYEFGLALEGLEPGSQDGPAMPLAEAGYYPWAIIQDHGLKRCDFISQIPADESQAIVQRLLRGLDAQQHLPGWQASEVQLSQSRINYRDAIQRIHEYILDGDCYQINYSQRFEATFKGAPEALYTRLREHTAAPFSAYFTGSRQQTLCLSPERFVQVIGQSVLTQPIKGTAPRRADPQEDHASAEALRASEKNRAENLMIVDLLRNDFGKVCVPGSISVPELFELQSFASIHHLVSSITGQLREDRDALDLLAAVFPGGSITGAPKRRAMEIIVELESHRRSAYCGSVFYLSCNRRLDSNILIRTVVCDKDTVYCWGGGGIVLDSTVDEEWQEIRDKVGALLRVIENP